MFKVEVEGFVTSSVVGIIYVLPIPKGSRKSRN
jgi:hypothetical protein